MPKTYLQEFSFTRYQINELLSMSSQMLSTCRFDRYDEVLDEAEQCKKKLSMLRNAHINRMHKSPNTAKYNVSLIYLNVLQESHEFLCIMRHQLRAGRKLLEEGNHCPSKNY